MSGVAASLQCFHFLYNLVHITRKDYWNIFGHFLWSIVLDAFYVYSPTAIRVYYMFLVYRYQILLNHIL